MFIPTTIPIVLESGRDLVIYYSMFIQADGTLEDERKQQVIDAYLDKLLERKVDIIPIANRGGVSKIMIASLFGVPEHYLKDL